MASDPWVCAALSKKTPHLHFFTGCPPPAHRRGAMTLSPPPLLHLTLDERATLEAWASDSSKSSQSSQSSALARTGKRALRAAIVLAAAEGRHSSSIASIASDLHVQPSTASKWLRRFVQERLAGLDDRPRSGAPRRITEERITDVVRRTLEPTPLAARPWSRRTMSHATGLSRSTVHRIWSRLDIAPNRPTSEQ